MAKVLLKALDILALFDHSRPEWAEHEVAAALDLPTSTAHRLLTSLRSRGYVVRTRSGRYRLGPAAMALGRRASDGPLAPSLHAALERVAAETGETAVVGIRDPAGGGLLILDQLESSQRLRLALEIGYVQPLHAGAASKAMLAHLEPREIERVLTEPIPGSGRRRSRIATCCCATWRASAASGTPAAAKRSSRAAGGWHRPSWASTDRPERSWASSRPWRAISCEAEQTAVAAVARAVAEAG